MKLIRVYFVQLFRWIKKRNGLTCLDTSSSISMIRTLNIEKGLYKPQAMGCNAPSVTKTASPDAGGGLPIIRSTAPLYTIGFPVLKSWVLPFFRTTFGIPRVHKDITSYIQYKLEIFLPCPVPHRLTQILWIQDNTIWNINSEILSLFPQYPSTCPYKPLCFCYFLKCPQSIHLLLFSIICATRSNHTLFLPFQGWQSRNKEILRSVSVFSPESMMLTDIFS